jgi:hypothetical protein
LNTQPQTAAKKPFQKKTTRMTFVLVKRINHTHGNHNYTGSNAPENARSTFLHEYCHAIDRTIKEFIKPYGKDGSHYGSEKQTIVRLL